MNNVPSVGIIGNGFIGSSIYNAFLHYTDVKIFDTNPVKSLHDYVDVIAQDVIFLAVPTPMKKDGTVDCSFIETSLQKLTENIVPDDNLKPVIIKSTVPPNELGSFMLRYAEKLLVIFNPEFLTERSAKYEYIQSNRFIFGTLKGFDTTPEAKLVESLFSTRFPAVPQYWRSFATASLVKYFTNVFFANKLSTMNEFAQVANSWGVDPNDVISLVMMEPRIGRSHFQVPGHDGKKGWSGSCLEGNTWVVTDKGARKRIKDVKVGEKVFDGEEFTTVTAVNSRLVGNFISIYCNNVKLTGSLDHIHMVVENGGFKEKLFKDLTVEDTIYFPYPHTYTKLSYDFPDTRNFKNGLIGKISKIEWYTGSLRVYSIETESSVYMANGMLTHNCFIKDTNGYAHLAREAGVEPTMAMAAWKKNVEVRGPLVLTEELNEMVGRAASDTFTLEDVTKLGDK